jgi:hypothetical protein
VLFRLISEFGRVVNGLASVEGVTGFSSMGSMVGALVVVGVEFAVISRWIGIDSLRNVVNLGHVPNIYPAIIGMGGCGVKCGECTIFYAFQAYLGLSIVSERRSSSIEAYWNHEKVANESSS